MELKQIADFLGQQAPADEMTGAFLEDAVAGFASNPAGATRSIRDLQANDPSGFLLAAVRLLTSEKLTATNEPGLAETLIAPPGSVNRAGAARATAEIARTTEPRAGTAGILSVSGGRGGPARTSKEAASPGVQYVAGLIFAGDVLIDPLMDTKVLNLDSAKALARNLVSAEPLLDVRMVTKMMTRAGGDIRAVDVETALRVLAIAENISDCSRLSFHLVQLLRHPSPRLRSKVALLIGRANLNLSRIKSLLSADDARLRANAVESLWGAKDPKILELFEESSRDQHHRVVINALVGLYMAGHKAAADRLNHLAGASATNVRAGSAWAMGILKDAGFAETLRKLSQDPQEQVSAMARRSLLLLPLLETPPEAPQEPPGAFGPS